MFSTKRWAPGPISYYNFYRQGQGWEAINITQ